MFEVGVFRLEEGYLDRSIKACCFLLKYAKILLSLWIVTLNARSGQSTPARNTQKGASIWQTLTSITKR